MRFLFDGGLGDQLAGTALVREFKRQFPTEMIRVEGIHYKPVWERNPHIRSGSKENGITATLGLHAHETLGSIAHSFAKQTAGFLGLDFQITNDTPEIHLSVSERDRGRAILETLMGRRLGRTGQRVALLDPNAMWPSRRWPEAHWHELLRLLHDAGWYTVSIGSSSNDMYGNPTFRMATAATLVDRTSVRESAAVMAASDLFVGNDSGGFHLAAAAGCPQVAIFGVKKWYARGYWNTTAAFPYQDCLPTCIDICEGPVYAGAHCLATVLPWRVAEAAEWSWQRHGQWRRS
jgi:ADP-heptose:LPS heptosyltransferase